MASAQSSVFLRDDFDDDFSKCLRDDDDDVDVDDDDAARVTEMIAELLVLLPPGWLCACGLCSSSIGR